MKLRMKTLPLLALPVVLVALAGCGSSSSSSSAAGGGATTSSSSAAPATSSTAASSSAASGGGGGGAVSVKMQNLAFVPVSIHAKVGQKIDWTNDDTAPHNVTYVSGPKFSSSGTLAKGGKFSITVSQAGTIHYFCSIHPFMKATIVVSK
jgi:plastocyanin